MFTQQMISGLCPEEGWKSHEGKQTGEPHPAPKAIPCPFVLGLLGLPRRQGCNGQVRSWGSVKGCFCPINTTELGGCLPSLLNCFLSSESRASIPVSGMCLENMACPHSRLEVVEKCSPPTAFHVSTAELPRFAFPRADFQTPRRCPRQASQLV